MLWQKFERKQIGERGPFVVWGFRNPSQWVRWEGAARCHRDENAKKGETGEAFFQRVGHLSDLGLLQWVPHLVEGDGSEAEIIHPDGFGRSTAIEDRLGQAALSAGAALLTPEQLTWALKERYWLAPVPRHMGHVQMVGIARLRYRPRTRATAAWWAHLNAEAENHLAVYRRIATSTGSSTGSINWSWSSGVGAHPPTP